MSTNNRTLREMSAVQDDDSWVWQDDLITFADEAPIDDMETDIDAPHWWEHWERESR